MGIKASEKKYPPEADFRLNKAADKKGRGKMSAACGGVGVE
jgi:hypothetical protein